MIMRGSEIFECFSCLKFWGIMRGSEIFCPFVSLVLISSYCIHLNNCVTKCICVFVWSFLEKKARQLQQFGSLEGR